jgi:sec-independent protein translocase protein TatC
MIGLFVAIPVILYQLIRFIEPALTKRFSKSTIVKILFSSMGLAIAGAAFGYYVILPLSLKFFSGYSTTTIKPLISASEYLNYVVNILITFILLSQIPLIFLFINMIKPLKPRGILKYQKWVIVASFAIAVILPFTYAPITQFLMAAPIIVLYYLSIILLAIVNRRANNKVDSAEEFNQNITLAKLTTPKKNLDGIFSSRADIDATNARMTSIRKTRMKNIEPITRTRNTKFVDGFTPNLT